MHQSFMELREELVDLSEAVTKLLPSNSLISAAGDWTMPALPGYQIGWLAKRMANLIDNTEFQGEENLAEAVDALSDGVRQVRTNMMPNARSHSPAYGNLLGTMLVMESFLKSLMPDTDTRDLSKRLNRAKGATRALEGRLNDLSPRSEVVGQMIQRIEDAYEAAERLPTDLEDLHNAKTKAAEHEHAAQRDATKVEMLATRGEESVNKLEETAAQADSTLSRLDAAYSAATSQGLAAAFSDRSKALDQSMWFWIIGLLVALVTAITLGAGSVRGLLNDLADTNASGRLLAARVVLAGVSIGGPIWLAWLSTKQIGHRFRLSEDYAFKAAISKAYEGYRKEARRVDPELEKKLLASALARLDEQPLRLVEQATHGSPWQEIASSDVVKEALKVVPNAGSKFIEAAKDMLVSQAKSPSSPPTPATASAPAPVLPAV